MNTQARPVYQASQCMFTYLRKICVRVCVCAQDIPVRTRSVDLRKMLLEKHASSKKKVSSLQQTEQQYIVRCRATGIEYRTNIDDVRKSKKLDFIT